MYDWHIWGKMQVLLVRAKELLRIVPLVIGRGHLVYSELLNLYHIAALQQLGFAPLLHIWWPLTLISSGCGWFGGRSFTLIDRCILCGFLDPCVSWGWGGGGNAFLGLWNFRLKSCKELLNPWISGSLVVCVSKPVLPFSTYKSSVHVNSLTSSIICEKQPQC